MLQFLVNPLFDFLQLLNGWTGNLGLSIILLTLIVRAALVPLTYPSLKAQNETRRKMKEIQPKLNALKKKHAKDRVAMAQAQQALFKEHDIRVTAGLLPNILQLIVLIAVYQVFQRFLHPDVAFPDGMSLFLGLDLLKNDPTYIMPILAGATQLLYSVMLLPGLEKHDLIPDDSKSKKLKEANKEEEKEEDMTLAIQQQMVFILPFTTAFIAARFPAGFALYWVITTVFSIVQQYTVSGIGGVEKYVHQVRDLRGRLKI